MTDVQKPWRIAILVSKFNDRVTGGLLKECRKELEKGGVRAANIDVDWVPGAYELPYAANTLAKTGRYQAVICLGCVIKGATSHDVYISPWAATGIGQVSLATGVPTLFGVLTPNNEKQAILRSKPGRYNRGKEVAQAALEMIEFTIKRST